MTLLDILALALLAVAGWLLWDGLKAREIANVAMREACAAQGLLFLDDTVALVSLRPVRNDEGRVQWQRVFGFEYSDTGHDRRKGRLTLHGHRVAALDIASPEDAAPPSSGAVS
jgi:hypothetical protein